MNKNLTKAEHDYWMPYVEQAREEYNISSGSLEDLMLLQGMYLMALSNREVELEDSQNRRGWHMQCIKYAKDLLNPIITRRSVQKHETKHVGNIKHTYDLYDVARAITANKHKQLRAKNIIDVTPEKIKKAKKQRVKDDRRHQQFRESNETK